MLEPIMRWLRPQPKTRHYRFSVLDMDGVDSSGRMRPKPMAPITIAARSDLEARKLALTLVDSGRFLLGPAVESGD